MEKKSPPTLIVLEICRCSHFQKPKCYIATCLGARKSGRVLTSWRCAWWINHPPGLPLQWTRNKASQVNSNRRWPVISSPILGNVRKKINDIQKAQVFLMVFIKWSPYFIQKIMVMNFPCFKQYFWNHYFFKALFLEVHWKMCWTWRCHDPENRREKRSSSHESDRPGFLGSNKHMFAKVDTL